MRGSVQRFGWLGGQVEVVSPTKARARTPRLHVRHNRPGDHPIRTIRGRPFVPAATIDEAVAAIKALGVETVEQKRDFYDEKTHLDILNRVSKGLFNLSALGYTLPPNLQVLSEPFARNTVPEDIHAQYTEGNKTVAVNANARFWADPYFYAQQGYSRKWWSTNDPDALIYHEVGHYLHAREVGWREFSVLTYDAPHRAPRGDKELVKNIDTEVSSYGMKSKAEFVAEVFAGHISGRTFSQPVLDYYEKVCKGPMLYYRDDPSDVGPGGHHE